MSESSNELKRVTEIVAKQAGVNPDQVAPETRLVGELAFDSLDVMEIVMEVEDEFGIVVEEDAVQQLRTVREVTDYVISRKGAVTTSA